MGLTMFDPFVPPQLPQVIFYDPKNQVIPKQMSNSVSRKL